MDALLVPSILHQLMFPLLFALHGIVGAPEVSMLG